MNDDDFEDGLEEGTQPAHDEMGPGPRAKSELDYALDGYAAGTSTTYEQVMELFGEYSSASLAFQWGQWAKSEDMQPPDVFERFPGTYVRVDGIDYEVVEGQVKRLNPDDE